MSTQAGPIVVGYAGSDASRTAVGVAADLAEDLATQLRIVHVVDLSDYPVDPDAADWEQHAAENVQQQREEIGLLMADRGADWAYELAQGDPVRALVELATTNRARMIVVGTRGASTIGAALERLLGGSRSVAHALERSAIPVLVVPIHRPDATQA